MPLSMSTTYCACGPCKGRGVLPPGARMCTTCSGVGMVNTMMVKRGFAYVPHGPPCMTCHCMGYVVDKK